MSKVRMNMWLAKCHSSKFWSTLKYNQFRRVHHSNFGTFPSHKKCHAQPSNIKQSKYIQVHLTRKTLRKKPLNQTIESTEAPPQKFKWFFVNEKLSHISSQLDQLLNSSVGTVFISTVSTLRQGVHVFGFIMAVIIVGGKKGSNRLRLGGAIFQILLLMRPEAGKLRSYQKKTKKYKIHSWNMWLY